MKKIFDNVEFDAVEYFTKGLWEANASLYISAMKKGSLFNLGMLKEDKREEKNLKTKNELLDNLNTLIYKDSLLQDITEVITYMNQIRPLLINNQIALDFYDKAYAACTKLFLNITNA
uniref:Uncharacterized protein n=1 Tax=viral metagenome TaxID=1070528 RepID=A0A6H1ZWH9_9ZZZZ